MGATEAEYRSVGIASISSVGVHFFLEKVDNLIFYARSKLGRVHISVFLAYLRPTEHFW